MPRIEVQSETEVPRGWRYRVIIHEAEGPREHSVRLSWVDHDHWSGGRLPPSRVVEALMACLVRRPPAEALPASFDAARIRRWIPTIDADLKEEFSLTA